MLVLETQDCKLYEGVVHPLHCCLAHSSLGWRRWSHDRGDRRCWLKEQAGWGTPSGGSGLLGWTVKHWPDQLMPTAMDSPEGAPLPDTERGHGRPNPASQVVLCDPEAMLQEPLCQLGQRVKRSTEERGEEIRQHLSYLVHSLGPSCAPAKGTIHTPLCGSSPTGIPASSRKSSRMPSCPASEHRILLWVPTSPSTVNSLGCGV
ncbi:uncharacterized protein LOC118658975 isoform X1 [Myotis myotis]|nr:uncharacterized protein LOC118658975 isoform X1 [Myotis myotis]